MKEFIFVYTLYILDLKDDCFERTFNPNAQILRLLLKVF